MLKLRHRYVYMIHTSPMRIRMIRHMYAVYCLHRYTNRIYRLIFNSLGRTLDIRNLIQISIAGVGGIIVCSTANLMGQSIFIYIGNFRQMFENGNFYGNQLRTPMVVKWKGWIPLTIVGKSQRWLVLDLNDGVSYMLKNSLNSSIACYSLALRWKFNIEVQYYILINQIARRCDASRICTC